MPDTDEGAGAPTTAADANAAPAAKLTDEHKQFVVQRLAAFEGPKAVADALRAQFGIVLTQPAVSYYDPTTYAGRNLSRKWRDLFLTTRDRILVAARREIEGTALPGPEGRVAPADTRDARIADAQPAATPAPSVDTRDASDDEARLQAVFALLQRVKARRATAPDAFDPLRLFGAAMDAAEGDVDA